MTDVSKPSFLKYGAIGVINTIFSYSLIFLLFYIGIVPEISNLVGYFFGILVSYILNRRYNFKSSNRGIEEFPKFFISMGIAYLINLATLSLCYRLLEINVYISQIFAGSLYVFTGYLLSKNWVFRRSKKYENY